ncbi:MAG: DUF4445 domain-containing protein [Candidatus Coatesbacteria bacterium]|nr:DUF4445 domain-containing protein [Candidatus Coatesbacteria bacterium]
MPNSYVVLIEPDGLSVPVEDGVNLQRLLAQHSIFLSGTCGGRGACRKCKVRVRPEGSEQAEEALACQYPVSSNLTVTVPPGSRVDMLTEDRLQTTANRIAASVVREPLVRREKIVWDQKLALKEPSVADSLLAVMRRNGLASEAYSVRLLATSGDESGLSGLLRADTGDHLSIVVFGRDVLRVAPEEPKTRVLGLAVDLGTTTVAASLLDLESSESLGFASALNQQTQFGADVISRIGRSMSSTESRKELADALASSVRSLVETLATRSEAAPSDIYQVAFTGNTTMFATFLEMDCTPLVSPPYRAPEAGFMALRRGDARVLSQLGLPRWTRFDFLPGVGGFVGSDVLAGLFVATMRGSQTPLVFLDIGTNGEVVVSSGDRMLASSAAAGPAFEGGEISCGMPASPGAIHRAAFEGGRIDCGVIGGGRPTGICGSGLIDACAALLEAGVISPSGRFVSDVSSLPTSIATSLRLDADQPAFLFSDDVFITQEDVRKAQLAKSAIRTCIELLLAESQTEHRSIDRLLLSGAFGSFVNPESAERIGLIPKLENARKQSLGNTALAGAMVWLLNRRKLKEIRRLRKTIQYMNLAGREDFEELFTNYLAFE